MEPNGTLAESVKQQVAQFKANFEECVESMMSYQDLELEQASYMCYLCTDSGISFSVTCPSTLPIWPTVVGVLAVVCAALGTAVAVRRNRPPWHHCLNSLFRSPGNNLGLTIITLLVMIWAVVMQNRAAVLGILKWKISRDGGIFDRTVADVVFVNVLAFSTPILVLCIFLFWWLWKAMLAVVLGSPFGRQLLQRASGGYIMRDWGMAASADVFESVVHLVSREQSRLFVIIGLVGVPYFSVAMWMAMPTFPTFDGSLLEDINITDASNNITDVIGYAQPNLAEVLSEAWDSFPRPLNEAKDATDSIISSTIWAAACFSVLGYLMLSAILMPTQMFASAAVNSAIWTAGKPRLRRMMAIHGIVLSTVVFAVAATLTNASSPLGPILAFIYLLLVLAAACLALLGACRPIRTGSGLMNKGTIANKARSFEWVVFLPLLLIAGNAAINFLTPLPAGSFILIILAMQIVIIMVLLVGFEGLCHCRDVLRGMLRCVSATTMLCWEKCALHKSGRNGAKGKLPQLEGPSRPKKPERIPTIVEEIQEGSALRARMIILVLILWVLATPPANVTLVLVSWLMVAALVAVAVLVWEAPCTFEELVDGPRLGLLVSAHDLAVALEMKLSGYEKADRQKQSLRLRRVKGSPFRMGETLAISYRWQPTAVTIAHTNDDLSTPVQINMSKWQMGQVLAAIRRTGLRFVWLDKLSVPQDKADPRMAELRESLLARMMAVYAAAAQTLALRSREEETGRYHQRAWALLEYCSSRRLQVVTEPNALWTALDPEDPRLDTALTDEEELRSAKLRRMVQGSMCNIVATWVHSSKSNSGISSQQGCEEDAPKAETPQPISLEELAVRLPDLASRVETFESLYTKLHCQEPADRVRALLPMLFDSPVELQVDLENYMQCLTEAFPTPALQQALCDISPSPLKDLDNDNNATAAVVNLELSIGN